MKITDLRTETTAETARVVATVTWEDIERPTRDIYFAVSRDHAERLRCQPDAFVLGALMPASRYRQRRILVEGAMCPELMYGIRTALTYFRSWYGAEVFAPVIECTQGERVEVGPAQPFAAAFASGGLDSLSMLRTNRRNYTPDHPRWYREGILIHGVDMGSYEGAPDRSERFANTRRALLPICEDAQLPLVEVHTNMKHLAPNLSFWFAQYLGAGVSAVAHAMGAKYSDVHVAGSDYAGVLKPAGTHPLIDGLYSTSARRIHHEQIGLRRLDKARNIADWPVALDHLRVCFDYPDDPKVLNCGKCRKCIFTQLELLVVGKLAQCPTFERDDMTPADIAAFPAPSAYSGDFLRELIEPLRDVGRADLADAIVRLLEKFEGWPMKVRREAKKRLESAGKASLRSLRRAAKKWR